SWSLIRLSFTSIIRRAARRRHFLLPRRFCQDEGGASCPLEKFFCPCVLFHFHALQWHQMVFS
ncbi:MAG: hypothetical protein ACLRNW_25235, partial [Neglectibacter sp.]